METVLVTGACGFLGRHVARAFAFAGHTVLGLGHGSWDRLEWREWGLSAWQTADVTIQSLRSFETTPDLIVHCAGSGSIAFSFSNPSRDFERTVTTTHEVLEFIRLYCPDTRLVFPSSASVYGNAVKVPISVGSPLRPISPYGIHKQRAESLCFFYSHHFDLSIAVVRFFSIYGVGLRKQLLWDACVKFSKESGVFEGVGDETRDWLHVEDAAALLLAIGLDHSSRCLIINGATGVAVTIRYIVEQAAVAFGVEDCVRFTGIRRPGDPLNLVADTQDFEGLKWRPTYDLDTELVRYVDWFKSFKS